MHSVDIHLLLAAAVDPALYKLVVIGVVIIGLSVVLRRLKQPYIVAYIIAGVLLGQEGFGIITDRQLIAYLGDFGLILLLFFIGMEIDISRFVQQAKIAAVGTTLQILLSVGLMSLIGWFFDWPWSHIVVMGFAISLSSSAVVIKLLQDRNESDSRIGQNVVGILLMQDILIVPMLIIAGYLGGERPGTTELLLQIIGGLLIIATIVWIIRIKEFSLPFGDRMAHDHELQVFFALITCLGCSLISAMFGLSAALGAFVGGILVHAAKSSNWFHDSLHSFRVIFIAVFFISIGMLIDFAFILENWPIVLSILVVVYLCNQVINSVILRYLNCNFKESIYGGALLAQIGELSFVLVASAHHTGIISEYTHQLSIITISLTILSSPFWISLICRLQHRPY